MLTTTEIAGFVGAGLAGAAYVPQISHLIKARCSAGISRLAFAVWLLASILITARAIAIQAGPFIVLGGIQIVATALIVLYAARYKDTPCPSHLPREPTAKTATGTGSSADEPGCLRPADLASQQQGGAMHDGALLANFSAARPAFPRTAGFRALLRAFSRQRGTSACRRALRERCSSYLRPCTGFRRRTPRETR
jgi:uncharacterized protein with PQ loop repeat